MRNLIVTVSLLAALVACGPSNKEVSMAKQARYQGDKLTLFNAARAAAESKYALAKVDEVALGFQTKGRWFSQDGVASPGSDEDMRQVPDKSIRMTLVVRLLADGSNWIIQVEPAMLRRLSGSPKPMELDPKDPSVPGWAQGQVDMLQFEIYQALKSYEVKAPGGLAPAPTEPAAAPAPTEPTEPAPIEPAAAP